MARAYNATCIVLHKTKLGETDAILTMLASDGHQIRAVAKGLRRPGSRIGARLEPFSEVELLLHPGRNLDVVGEVQTVQTHAACREDLVRTSSCAAIAEFLSQVTRDAAIDERVYRMTEAVFACIDVQPSEEAGLYAAAFLLKAQAMMGLCPALHECAACGKPVEDDARIDIAAGGVLCADCCARKGVQGEVDARVVSWIDLLVHATFAELAEVGSAPIRDLLDFCESWLREHLSLNLRSLAFLKAAY